MSLTADAKHGPKPDKKAKLIKCEGKGAPDEECFFYGDARADAPELAYRGSFDVGVRTLKVVNPNQIDILNYSAENPEPRYDRRLTLEVWYPAKDRGKKKEVTTYQDVLGSGPGDPERPLIPFEFAGRALRNAEPNSKEGPYPLVIVSHGYPGSRVLMTYLTENLASKGYVVAAIDHTESTHADKVGFSSTLLNRTLDINFVIEHMAQLSAEKGKKFLAGVVNADKTAVIGYSMGGYGALIAAGAGVYGYSWVYGSVPGGYMEILRAGSPAYAALLDPRIKAIVPFAPWGGHYGTWDAAGLSGLTVPSLFIVGNQDRTANYSGVAFLFENAVNSDRYMLVYQNGIHEVAVNPPPPEAEEHFREYIHYQEPAWDNRRCNNINQHFITAFLGIHLKGMDEYYQPYLDLIPISNDASPGDADYWMGFKDWTAVGLELHHLTP